MSGGNQAPARRELRLRAVMHADLVKGGWMWAYEILDNGKIVGSKSVLKETRRSPEQITYALLDDDATYASAAEFRAAYEARLAALDEASGSGEAGRG